MPGQITVNQIGVKCKCGVSQTYPVPLDLDATPVLECRCPGCDTLNRFPVADFIRHLNLMSEQRKRAQVMKPMLPALLPKAIAWAQERERLGIAAGRPLSQHEIGLARKVGVAHPEHIRINLVKEIPTPDDPFLKEAALQTGLAGPNIAGLTLGYAVFVRVGHESDNVLAHEFRHVFQVEQAGSLTAHLTEYLGQIVDHGYIGAPFELDASTTSKKALVGN